MITYAQNRIYICEKRWDVERKVYKLNEKKNRPHAAITNKQKNDCIYSMLYNIYNKFLFPKNVFALRNPTKNKEKSTSLFIFDKKEQP